MEENRLSYLFKKYLQHDLNQSELLEFYTLLLKAKDDDAAKLLMDDWYVAQTDSVQAAGLDNEKILAHVFQASHKSNRVTPVIWHRTWFKVAAAASVMMVLLWATTYFKTKEKAAASILAAQMILPAEDKASLKLSNGDVVLLDTMKIGTTKIVDGVKISKTNSGEIIYEALTNTKEQGTNELVTPKGGKYILVLPDKTKVWLNAGTKLKYPKLFNGPQRIVELSGEAYFEVAKIKDKAFVVKSGAQFVEVLGTHFNFNAYPDNEMTTTTLLEGSVKTGNQSYATMITPGEQAEYTANSKVQVRKADIESVMAWKNGDFIFKEKTLDLVMKEVARWYDVDVVFDDSLNPQQIKLVGWISRKKDLSAIIKNLETATGLSLTVEERRISVGK